MTVRRRMGGLAAFAALSLSFLVGSAQAAERTTTVRWGPIDLPAATADGPGERHNEIAGVSGFSSFMVSLFTSVADYEVTPPCEDCYITGVIPNLVLADGTPGNYNNGLMLHHVVNFNWSNPDITCRPNLFSSQLIKQLGGIVGGNERFFASGNERTYGIHPDGYGYYVAPGDDWGLTYHVMNMKPEPRTVYWEYTFTWVPASEAGDIKPLRPMWIDIDQCDDSEAVTSAGYNDLTWDWQADRTHTFVSGGGHVHDYGIGIAWRNETRSQTACSSVAGYAEGSPYVPVGPGTGADDAHPVSANTVTSDPLGLANYKGHISDHTTCDYGASGPRVQKGDLMRAHTQIYRPDDSDHDMGIMVGFLEEDFCITNFWCY